MVLPVFLTGVTRNENSIFLNPRRQSDPLIKGPQGIVDLWDAPCPKAFGKKVISTEFVPMESGAAQQNSVQRQTQCAVVKIPFSVFRNLKFLLLCSLLLLLVRFVLFVVHNLRIF
ncbi:MAG: hypothetical protein DWI02_11050 [Planctomycetota bacterium]|nr:MAG: hypothetical protein DWI02_11050 [Planctomycetota bacterium]